MPGTEVAANLSPRVKALSLPLVAIAGAATGVVLSLEARDSLIRFGAKGLLPALIVFSIIRESGPIITGLVVSGRVGAGTAPYCPLLPVSPLDRIYAELLQSSIRLN